MPDNKVNNSANKIVYANIIYNFGSTLLNEEDLLLIQAPSHGHLGFLSKQLNAHVYRVITDTNSKVIDGVQFHFFKGSTSKLWLALKLHLHLRKLKPNLVMVHGFSNPLQLFCLLLLVRSKFVIHYNGGGVPGGRKGQLQKLVRFFIKNYAFTSKEQTKEFVQKKFIHPKSNIYEIPEGSASLNRLSKQTARQHLNLGLSDTVFLWVGTLTPNKDPITVLNGLAEFLNKNSSYKVLMIYRTAELIKEVKLFIENNPTIKSQIILIGAMPQKELANYYCSADYFVLGSHYEGSGYSLIESMACGCIPIVTNIPSFYKLTNSGNLGVLWQTGNVNSFKEAIQKALNLTLKEESDKVATHFEKELSFKAIAEKQFSMISKVCNSPS